MKKVNLLIGLLYLNNLILIIFNLFLWDILNKIEIFNDNIFLVLAIWFILFLIFSIINIISIRIDFKNNDSRKLLKKMRRIKIGLIPFWVINFLAYIPICTILIVAGHGFGFLIVPIFIFASYIVLLLTSIFSILYLLNLRKNGIIQNKNLIIHTLLQLLFVFDIVDTIYIIKKWGKKQIDENSRLT